jgi:hypothetical protein
MYEFAYHSVNILDFYLGYHYAFFAAPFQNVKIYTGAEIMFNTVLSNELETGEKYMLSPKNDTKNIATKDTEFRIGGRIRAGFEGKLYQNIYLNASFAIGAYNLLLRNDANGELFNSKNNFETKELLQPFFNYTLELQYRFE